MCMCVWCVCVCCVCGVCVCVCGVYCGVCVCGVYVWCLWLYVWCVCVCGVYVWCVCVCVCGVYVWCVCVVCVCGVYVWCVCVCVCMYVLSLLKLAEDKGDVHITSSIRVCRHPQGNILHNCWSGKYFGKTQYASSENTHSAANSTKGYAISFQGTQIHRDVDVVVLWVQQR